MFDRLNDIIAAAGARLDRTAHTLVDRITKFAGSIIVLLVFGLLAAVALLTLCAAAVVALTPLVGAAGSLALVGGALLLTSIVVLLATSARLKVDAPSVLPKPVIPEQNAAASDPGVSPLDTHTAEVKPLPKSSTSSAGPAGIFEIPPVDPLLVTAAAGAALALLGPARIARTAARATASIALVRSIMPLLPTILSSFRTAANPPATPRATSRSGPAASTF